MASPAKGLVHAAELEAGLCRFEGFRLRAYFCPAGAATIDYVTTTTYLDLRSVALDDPLPSPEVAARLPREQVYPPGTRALRPRLRCDALEWVTDFAFNLGSGHARE